MKFSKVLILICLILPTLSSAQKIKYKDLFPLLNSKNYSAENEANLRIFLKNEKKPHANGNLQLAYIMEKEFYDYDLLADTTEIDLAADSAIFQLKKAKELIDEKELKRNDEYYQSFYRRDLRTGDFGIKISDVHLDLEKKVEDIEARKKAIADFNTLLHRIDGRNKLSAKIYGQMVEKGSTTRELLFSLTDDDLVLLDQIIANATGLYVLIDDLKESARELDSEYYQDFQVFKLIENYGIDGLEQSDVFSGKLDLWDYETWAKLVKDQYYGVKQYKTNLSAMEAKLSQAFDKVAQGIDPGAVEVSSIQDEAEKFDPDGSAKDLLAFRSSHLEINRMSNPSINSSLQDSLNVFAHLEAANIIMEELGEMTTIYSDISTPEKISMATNRYPGILEEYYGGSSGYQEFIENLGGWINSQKIMWASRTDSLMLKEKYAVSDDLRIPLFVNQDTQQHMTKLVSGDSVKVAVGMDTRSKSGFLVWSGPSRDVRKMVELKTGNITSDSLAVKQLPIPTFGFYFFDSSMPENNLFIAATDGAGQLKWSNLVTAPNEPLSFRYDEVLDQLTVFYFPQDQLPGDGVTAYIVIDRNGNVR